jgi:cytochrome c oxidase cbb3-type subunit III
MSDFTSGFWSIYVAVLVVASIAGCAWLLWVTGKVKVTAPKGAAKAPPGSTGQVEVTGHVWDGDLQEYNNPLPKWWSNLFWLTIVFGIVYLTLYPGLGSVPGVLGWTSRGAYQAETKDFDAKVQPLYDKYAPTRPRGKPASGCSSRIARRAMVRMPAARKASRTCATTTGCTAASRRTSSRRSPADGWA